MEALPELQRFIGRRRQVWDRLEQRLVLLEQRSRFFAPEEAMDAVQLYRMACADLAWLNSRYPDASVREPLNALVARAHLLLTPPPEARPIRLKNLYFELVPCAVRRQFRLIAAVSAVFAIVAGYAWFVSLHDPSRLSSWIPDFIREKIDAGEMWSRVILPHAPLVSSLIIVNNLAVSLIAVGSGVTLGVLTLELLLSNALMLGGIAGLAYHSPLKSEFFAFVSGHGPTELSAIMMCLAGGFLIPIGFLNPGDLPRVESLKCAARESAYLLLGALPMILSAGLVEAFISPNHSIPPALRSSVGFTLLALFVIYFAVMPAGEHEKCKG
ncbi:MAG: stage II sporulation protein M [bacterium JZ-2024 1]